jgi:hypothetical protein
MPDRPTSHLELYNFNWPRELEAKRFRKCHYRRQRFIRVTGGEHRIRLSTVSHANFVNNILDETRVFPHYSDKQDAVSHK